MEYTYDTYRSLLHGLSTAGYEFTHFDEAAGSDDRTVLLRHDVDWSPKRARRMAEIEAEMGVSATYFFLVSSPFYNVFSGRMRSRVAEIERLGHRVGLHFSTHQHWDEPVEPGTLADAVTDEQSALSTVANDLDRTVSFHIPPEWVLGTTYPAFRNAYAPPFFEGRRYVSDSNQKWRDQAPFDRELTGSMQILVHPGLWAETDATFTERLRTVRDDRFDAVQTYLHEQFVEEIY